MVKFAKLIPDLERVDFDFEEAVGMIDYIRQIELNRISVPVMSATTGDSGGANV